MEEKENTTIGVSDFHRSWPEPETSAKQAGGSYLHRSRYNRETAEGAGPSQRPRWGQSQTSNLCQSRYKGATSMRTGLNDPQNVE